MSRVFVIGAGFSKGLGSAPITNELFEILVEESLTIVKEDSHGWKKEAKNLLSILNYFNENVDDAVKRARGKTSDLIKFEGYYPINVEYLCTILELNAKYAFNPDSKEVSLDFPIPFLNGFSKQQLKRIVEFIKTHILNRLLPYNLSSKNDLLDKFVGFLNKGDTVISFNYDILLDQALFRNGVWNPINGYGFSNPVFDSEIKQEISESKIQLLKVHGSINWKIDPKNSLQKQVEILLNYQEREEPFFDGLKIKPKRVVKREANYHYNPAILPTFIKMYSEHWFSEIIQKALTSTRNADEVYLLGYSMPDPDSLGQFLLSNVPRKIKIQIVDLSTENTLEVTLKNKFGFRDVAFHQSKIEDWVKNQ